MSVHMPPWAIRLVLTIPGLEKAAAEVAEWEEEKDWMPEL